MSAHPDDRTGKTKAATNAQQKQANADYHRKSNELGACGGERRPAISGLDFD